ncbi:unnamed protein product [Aphanomyces euteiches]
MQAITIPYDTAVHWMAFLLGGSAVTPTKRRSQPNAAKELSSSGKIQMAKTGPTFSIWTEVKKTVHRANGTSSRDPTHQVKRTQNADAELKINADTHCAVQYGAFIRSSDVRLAISRRSDITQERESKLITRNATKQRHGFHTGQWISLMKWNGQVSCTNNFDQLLQLQRQHLSFNQHSTTYTPVQLQDCNQKNKDLPSNNFDLNSIWFNEDDEELVSEDLDMKSICLSQGEEDLTSSQHLDLNSICFSQDEEDLTSSEDLDCDDLVYLSQDEEDLTSSEDLDLSSIYFNDDEEDLTSSEDFDCDDLDFKWICFSQDEEDLTSSEDLDCDDLDLSSIYSSKDEEGLTSSEDLGLSSIYFSDDEEDLTSSEDLYCDDLDLSSIYLSQDEEDLTSSEDLDFSSIYLSQDEEDLISSEGFDCDDLDFKSIYFGQDEGDLTSSEDLDLSSICFSEESFSLARWAMLPSDGCSAVLKNCLDSGEALMKSAELSDLRI